MTQPNPRARARNRHEGSGVRHSRSLAQAYELSKPYVETQAYGLTDRGRVRESNEDQFLIAQLERSLFVEHSSVDSVDGTTFAESPQGELLMVADGMGGYGNGEVASSIAIEALARYAFAVMPWLLRHSHASEQELSDALRRALQHCHKQVKKTAEREGLDRRMGTTLTLAYVTWPELHIAHVGDSRCYLYRAGSLRMLTRDHTLAEQLVDENALSPEEAQRSRFRHVLINSVGGSSELVGVELHSTELHPGDQLLLCSDGLTGQVADDEIARRLSQLGPIEQTVAGLIRAANDAGGADNITVVLARF